MNRLAILFLVGLAPGLAAVLAWLGWETRRDNPLGWFLLLTGVVYALGIVIASWVRRKRFWESRLEGEAEEEERGDASFWFIALGMIAGYYLSPLEYLYCTALFLPRTAWMSYTGLGLVILGISLFIWARRTLGANYSGHVSAKADQRLVQSGPYRFIRHPAYLGYLGMALGISLGYSSLAGMIAIFVLLLPGMAYRIKVEEQVLSKHFGEEYRRYVRKTKRLIPGVW